MPQGTRPDWVAIRTEYESGVSRKEICAKYGLYYNTLDSKIRREHWNETRKNVARKVHEKCTNKIVQKKADEAVSNIDRLEKVQSRLIGLIERCMDEMDESPRIKTLDLERLANASNTLGDSKILVKQEQNEDQLIVAIKATRGRGADADIPV